MITWEWKYTCIWNLSSWYTSIFLSYSWWRHQMETFSALLALCAGNSPVTGEFPSQRPVTRSFDIFYDVTVMLSNNMVSNDLARCWCSFFIILQSKFNCGYVITSIIKCMMNVLIHISKRVPRMCTMIKVKCYVYDLLVIIPFWRKHIINEINLDRLHYCQTKATNILLLVNS